MKNKDVLDYVWNAGDEKIALEQDTSEVDKVTEFIWCTSLVVAHVIRLILTSFFFTR